MPEGRIRNKMARAARWSKEGTSKGSNDQRRIEDRMMLKTVDYLVGLS